MCGIVGARHDWLTGRGLDPESAMREAVARLRWRGPDGTGVVHIGGWWLGCARLAITQAASRQPVVRRGGRFAGVMNGAITNARELWARLLPGLDRRAELPNDAWLPLLAVERRDHEALRHLRGHHAYAVVDTATDALVFGQDRFGEKPLLLLHRAAQEHDSLVAFASTTPALEALGMPRAPTEDERGFADLLRFGFRAVEPHQRGPELILSQARTRGTPHVAGPARSKASPWSAPDTPWRAAPAESPTLRERFFAGVARCIDTRQPTGLLLSGGIDSSCIAAALHHARRRTPAFQFMARGVDAAERTSARAVAARCDLPFHPVDGGPEVLDALPHLTELAGMPLGDPSILAVHAVAKAAAANGVRILLGGEGADELFLGYRRYRALATMPHLHLPRAWVPQWSMRYLARWLRAAVGPDAGRVLLEVTPPAFRRTVLADAPEATPASPPGDPVERARSADLDGYLRCDLLPKIDIATMAAGIESRCPFLEGDYGEFGSDRSAIGKQPLRLAFANDLPDIVFRLPKRGFALPLNRWFRGEHWLLDLLAEPRTQQRQHLRPGGIATAVDRHRRGTDLGHGLYLLAAVELFLRRHES